MMHLRQILKSKTIHSFHHSKKVYKNILKLKHNKYFSTSFMDASVFDDIRKVNRNEELHYESRFSIKEYFDNFELDNFDHIPYAPTGSYMTLNDDDISTYFPEGLAGELNEEFEMTNEKKWMIRDPTKLVCRLIDNFEYYKKITNHERNDKIIQSNRIIIPTLTDNLKEWNDAVISVKHYGEELLNKQKISLKSSINLQTRNKNQDQN